MGTPETKDGGKALEGAPSGQYPLNAQAGRRNKMRYTKLLMMVLVAALVVILAPHLAYAFQDSTVVTPPASGPIGSIAGIGLGIAGVAATAGFKWLTMKADPAIGRVDTAFTNFVKPVQPLIATGFALLLPWLGAKIGVPILGQLDPSVVATSPVGVLTAIVGMEIFGKLGKAFGGAGGTS